jgi:uncharacterized protein YycO
MRFIPLKSYIKKGVNNHFIIKRLKDSKTILTDFKINKMKELGEKFLGKKYDFQFLWSENKFYCSELVWKLYKRGAGIEVGKLEKLGSFNLTHPHVKKTLKKRYGNNIPSDEQVISVLSLFKSKKLFTIYKSE